MASAVSNPKAMEVVNNGRARIWFQMAWGGLGIQVIVEASPLTQQVGRKYPLLSATVACCIPECLRWRIFLLLFL
jgi:hypothetical protein